MRILFLSAEVAPFVAVGGLSQVSYFLPKSLLAQKVDVRIFTAHHGAMDRAKKPWVLTPLIDSLSIPLDHSYCQTKTDEERVIPCSISIFKKAREPLVYFLENREYYKLRANVYGYSDDVVRWMLLSKGCLEFLKQLYEEKSEWFPDVIHCNDWHTSYFIELARTDERYSFLEKIPIVLTVHNFAIQGSINFRFQDPKKRDYGKKPLEVLDSPKLLQQNPLLRGLLYADEITTVSPTHALEVLTPEYGEGLEEFLNTVRGKIVGILNGLDIKEFNPAKDPLVYERYSIQTVDTVRPKNKLKLQKEFGLEQNASIPILAICGRINQQKGWNLLLEVLPHLLAEEKNVQIIVLGQGEQLYHDALHQLKSQFPEQIGLHLLTDFRLPRRIFAGSDIMLMPSNFEPGGIVALEALRYGAIPLVRRTGGLNDIIEDFSMNKAVGNGFSFTNKNPWSLYGTIIKALTIYSNKKLWAKLIQNAMKADFSWESAAKQYSEWYDKAIESRSRASKLVPHRAYQIGVSNQL